MFNNVMTGNYNTDPIPVYFKCPECGTSGPLSDVVSIVANGEKRFCPNCHTTIVKELDTLQAPRVFDLASKKPVKKEVLIALVAQSKGDEPDCDCCADIRRAEQELGPLQTKRPIWIEVEDGDVFSGTQTSWMDCFFTNAYEGAIRESCEMDGYKCVIREMTDEEIAQYPEAVETQKWLLETYGEC